MILFHAATLCKGLAMWDYSTCINICLLRFSQSLSGLSVGLPWSVWKRAPHRQYLSLDHQRLLLEMDFSVSYEPQAVINTCNTEINLTHTSSFIIPRGYNRVLLNFWWWTSWTTCSLLLPSAPQCLIARPSHGSLGKLSFDDQYQLVCRSFPMISEVYPYTSNIYAFP